LWGLKQLSEAFKEMNFKRLDHLITSYLIVTKTDIMVIIAFIFII
jgi:hypothetical protein